MTKRVLNCRPSLPDHRTPKYAAIKESRFVPSQVDLSALCSPVVDQGQIGSCSGNALAGAIEFLELAELIAQRPPSEAPQEYTTKFDPVSRLFIYWNERAIEGTTHQDAGAMTIRHGCDSLLQKGVCRESLWPYSDSLLLVCPHSEAYGEAWHHKLQSYYKLETLNDIRNCLAAGFPVAFGITIYDSFETDDVALTGLVPDPGLFDSVAGGHALLIVGYDDTDQTLLVRNSWGVRWGMAGYCKMSYAYVISMGYDFFTLRLDPATTAHRVQCKTLPQPEMASFNCPPLACPGEPMAMPEAVDPDSAPEDMGPDEADAPITHEPEAFVETSPEGVAAQAEPEVAHVDVP